MNGTNHKTGRSRLVDLGVDRQRRFADAARHSARVKWVRRGVIASVLLGTFGFFFIAFFNPFRSVRGDVTFGDIGLTADKITMRQPKMTGVRRDGRPYSLTARVATQNPHVPNQIEMQDLHAEIQMSDTGRVQVFGDRGVYDSTKETLELNGHASIQGPSYKLIMDKALMDFHTSALETPGAVHVELESGFIDAEGMNMIDSGAHIVFSGQVRSHFYASDEDSSALPSSTGAP